MSEANFEGLTSELFDTYAPERWSSMVHNLARMKGKEAVVALGKSVSGSIASKLEGLDQGSSDEIPNITNEKKVDSQWVYWYRDKQSRESLSSFLKTIKLDQASIFTLAAHHKHAVLAVAVRHEVIQVGLHVAKGASVDRQNMAAKLHHSWDREALLDLLKGCPEETRIGFDGDDIGVGEVSEDWLQKLGEGIVDDARAWWCGIRLSRDEALAAGADLGTKIAEQLTSFTDVYRWAAWTRENDHIEAAKKLQAEKQAKRQQATSYAKGDKVRVINGLFKGKNGIVEGTDANANVKVRVGKMTINLSGHDLTPA